MRLAIIALAVLVATPALAAKESKAEKARIAEIANRPIECTAGADCEMKWGRALTWILENAPFKITQQTDSLIATAGPQANAPQAAFTVSKVAKGDGVYSIVIRGGCDNMFGCTPSLDRSRASFVEAVTAP